MARKSRKHNLLILPSRAFMHRMGQALALGALVLLLVMGKNGNPAVEKLRMQLADSLAPVLQVVSAPASALSDAKAGLAQWVSVYHENATLKTERAELMKWQALAKDMQVENERLRGLLNVAPRRGSQFVSAAIVSDRAGAFSNMALVAAGKDDGVEPGQAVISERGLLGRVTAAGGRTAQVLLLTDVNSRIPVMNERTREKMILVGRGGGLPTLSYVASDSAMRAGDRVITSGDGGIFPRGVAVGVVRDADKSAPLVELFATLSAVEMALVVQTSR